MVRFLGGVMILLGTVGLGFRYRDQFYERVKVLCKLIHILEMMKSEIGYSKSTMPECCLHIGKTIMGMDRTDRVIGEGMVQVYELMRKNDGYSFSYIFKNVMKDKLCTFSLVKSDVEAFLSVADNGDYHDPEMQIGSIDIVRERLINTLQDLKKEVEGRGRIAVGLGILGGLFLLIILI